MAIIGGVARIQLGEGCHDKDGVTRAGGTARGGIRVGRAPAGDGPRPESRGQPGSTGHVQACRRATAAGRMHQRGRAQRPARAGARGERRGVLRRQPRGEGRPGLWSWEVRRRTPGHVDVHDLRRAAHHDQRPRPSCHVAAGTFPPSTSGEATRADSHDTSDEPASSLTCSCPRPLPLASRGPTRWLAAR